MRRLVPAAVLFLALTGPGVALAIDHKNLDEGRPLRLEDAYSIAHGEIALEVGAAGIFPRRGPDRAVVPVEILYGAFPNLQVSLGTQLSTDPRAIEEPAKSGDLHLSVLYNLSQETLTLPAFGVKGALNLPTGAGSAGVDRAGPHPRAMASAYPAPATTHAGSDPRRPSRQQATGSRLPVASEARRRDPSVAMAPTRPEAADRTHAAAGTSSGRGRAVGPSSARKRTSQAGTSAAKPSAQ